MKALEDWVVEPAFRTVPGIADVVGFGGEVKQYQVDLDPAKLQGYNVPLATVENAIASANENAGGGYIEHGYEKQIVRGVGIFSSVADIAAVAVATRNGAVVTVGDLGRAHIGAAPREGIVAKDSADDVVEGIVLMRKGENALDVLKGVRAKAEELNTTILPRDVRLVPFYHDRARSLRNHTVNTVEENLLIGATLVLVILIIFLGDWRSAVIVGLVIPLSLLGAFILMDIGHVSANLISLGAVDFGIIVDAAVVMVEAFLVRLALAPPLTEEQLRDRHATLVASEPSHEAAADAVHMELTGEHATPNQIEHTDFAMRADIARREIFARVAEAMGRPIRVLKVLIVITAFPPIFTFQRVEKRIFSPMALHTFVRARRVVAALHHPGAGAREPLDESEAGAGRAGGGTLASARVRSAARLGPRAPAPHGDRRTAAALVATGHRRLRLGTRVPPRPR